MKEFNLKIVADYNDADYLTEVTNIDQETLDMVNKVVPTIKSRKGHNAEDLYEFLEEEFDCEIADWFTDLCPYEEYKGIHTIISITVCPATEETVLL